MKLLVTVYDIGAPVPWRIRDSMTLFRLGGGGGDRRRAFVWLSIMSVWRLLLYLWMTYIDRENLPF